MQVKEPDQLVWTFRKAFRIAQEGRRGAVLTNLPIDAHKAEVESDFAPRRGTLKAARDMAHDMASRREPVERVGELRSTMKAPQDRFRRCASKALAGL